MTGIYGLIHMAVDLSCAFLMYAFVVGGEHWYIWLLAYNFCAFALQMPIGAGADRLDRNSLVATGGCGALRPGPGHGRDAGHGFCHCRYRECMFPCGRRY